MKTFTVTICSLNNYGALFQAYALQQTILHMGHTNEVLNYHRNVTKLKKKSMKMLIRNLYTNALRMKHKEQLTDRETAFRDFYASKMNMSEEYMSMEQLRNSPPDADVLITGSDQVWRITNDREFIPARFLNFGAESAKRISYAASMESLSVCDDDKRWIANSLAEFTGISVREGYVKDFIQELTDQPVTRVLDPVFLLEREAWGRIAKKPRITGRYILCYQVQGNSRMQETVNYLKRITKYQTVAILPDAMKWIHTDVSLYDVSPEEFIGLFQNADIVVSASFHGVAFGLMFGKPTYALAKEHGGNRIKEIMKLFHLEKFCITNTSDIPMPNAFSANSYSELLKREKAKSLEFLHGCL